MKMNENLFLTMKCRNCSQNYVFWRGTTPLEVEKWMKKCARLGVSCCDSPTLRGVIDQ